MEAEATISKEAPAESRKVEVDWSIPSSPFIGVRQMKGRIASVDFETFYDKKAKYSVTNMTPYQYVRDPRFDAYMVAIESDLGEVFIGRPETFYWGSLDGATLPMHNASFDGAILNRLIDLGKVPDFKRELVCTIDLVSYLNRPRSLKDAASCLLGVSMSKAVRTAMDGVSYAQVLARGPKTVEELLAYAGDDAKHCLALYLKYGDLFPKWERQVSKCNREAGWNGIAIDTDRLEAGLATLKGELWKAQQELPWIEDGRKGGSVVALADHARSLGLDVPKSFKRDNPEMMEWVAAHADEHPFIRARLTLASLKPHIARLESLKDMIDEDGLARIPCRYHGTHTGRASGASESDSKFNILNITKDPVYGVDMRAVLMPRKGHKYLIFDYGQIEARIVQWLAGNFKFLDILRAEGNLYQATAKQLGWFPMDATGLKQRDKKLYALSKETGLGLGFSMGAPKFMTTCEKKKTELPCFERSRWDLSDNHLHVLRNKLGIDANNIRNEKEEIKIGTYFGAFDIVSTWRRANTEVVDLWRNLQNQLDRAAAIRTPIHEFELPSGRIKRYFKPHYVREPVKYIDLKGVERTKLDKRIMASHTENGKPHIYHGGLITENLVQAFARDIMYKGAMDVVNYTAWAFLWNAYDEVIFEVPEDDCERATYIIPRLLCYGSASAWTQGLPLEVEGGIFDHYTK